MSEEKLIQLPLPELEKRLIKNLHLYIRLRDTDDNGYGPCFTCNAWVYYKEADAGHYIRSTKRSTRFYDGNIFLQCKICNQVKDGMEKEFKKRLIKSYGRIYVDRLWDMSNGTADFDRAWYVEKILYYKNMVDLLHRLKAGGGRTPPALYKFDLLI